VVLPAVTAASRPVNVPDDRRVRGPRGPAGIRTDTSSCRPVHTPATGELGAAPVLLLPLDHRHPAAAMCRQLVDNAGY